MSNKQKLYISNAFSLSMLDRELQSSGLKKAYPVDFPRRYIAGVASIGSEIISAVGHANTAEIFTDLLGIEIKANRMSITLGPDDSILVGQYIGPRLQEGATELPEGARIEWWIVS